MAIEAAMKERGEEIGNEMIGWYSILRRESPVGCLHSAVERSPTPPSDQGPKSPFQTRGPAFPRRRLTVSDLSAGTMPSVSIANKR